jgi:cystathionine beta-lyase/cystathionine gamma-synthase
VTKPRGPGTRAVHGGHGLGGVESLASLPVLSSQRGLPEAAVRAAGIDPGMVRLSIGVEDEADLVADLERALAG